MQLPAYLALAVCAALTVFPADAQPVGRSPHTVFQDRPTQPLPSQPPPGDSVRPIHGSYEAAAPAPPAGLALTLDQDLCTQHAGPTGRRFCLGLSRPGAAALVWDAAGAADGFQVYRVVGGRPAPLGPPSSRADLTAAIIDGAAADGGCYAVAAVLGGRQSQLSETVCPAPAASQAPRPDYSGASDRPRPGPRRPSPDEVNDQSPDLPGLPGHRPRPDYENAEVVPPSQPPPPPSPTAQKARVPADQACSSGVWPGGVFLEEYMRLGGPNGPMGCPLYGPDPIANMPGGLAMGFQNGQISTNDGVWPGGVIGAYQHGLSITVDWAVHYGETHPGYNYDKFVVRLTNLADPSQAQQHDVIAKMDRPGDTHLRSQGTFTAGWSSGATIVQVSVEGCDNPTGDILKASPFNGRCLQGWMAPANILFRPDPGTLPPDDTAFVNFGLMGAHQPTSVADSKAQFGLRAAAALLPAACSLLYYAGYDHEESYRQSLLAKMLYAEYFDSDHCPGRRDANGYISNRQEVYDSLMTQTLLGDEQTGSTFDDIKPPDHPPWLANICGEENAACPPYRKGEYDVLLVGYAGLLSRYGGVVPANVYHHVLYDLMTKTGPPNPGDTHISVAGIGGDETENHQLNIFTSQYLANQMLYRDTGDARYDNARNGMNAFMAGFLHNLLSRDFLEYNARPYQDYSVVAVSFLSSFASDANDAPPGAVSSHAVKLAARMVLDYVTAKMAVSSDDARRVAPYRRRADKSGDHDTLGPDADPQGPRVLQLAGVGVDQLTWPAGMGISNYTLQMVDAAFSSYRPPDLILDEFINREHRRSLEIFRHAGDEIYWKSTSYMLSAGGRHVDDLYPHKLGGGDIAAFATAVTAFLDPPGLAALAAVGGVSGLVASAITISDDDARGMALPTTLIPAAPVRSRDDMLRFLGAGKDDTEQSQATNLCVSKAFACGQALQVPPSFFADRACYASRPGVAGSNWMFFDLTGRCSPMRPYGFYVAVWSAKSGDRTDGLVEVYDRETSSAPVAPTASTNLHNAESPLFEHGDAPIQPGPPAGGAPAEITTFPAFINDVVRRNETKAFSISGVNDGPNSYETAAGDRIAFQIGPDSRIEGQAASGLASGSFLSADGAGRVSITNTMVGEVLTLDDSDPAAPVRSLRAGPRSFLGNEKLEEPIP